MVLLASCAGLGFRFMVGAFPVLTLVPGIAVSVCCARSLPSCFLCIGRLDLRIWGISRISYQEIVILFEQWAGHRLLSEKVTRPHVRALRPISISSVPVSEGIEIGQERRSNSSLVRDLG